MVEHYIGDFGGNASSYSLSCIWSLHPLRTRRADKFVKPIETTLVRIAVELDLFTAVSKSDGGPKSVEELASDTGADPVLLGMSVFERQHVQANLGVSTDSPGTRSRWSGETDQRRTFRGNERIKNLYGAFFERWFEVLVGLPAP